MFRLRFIHCTMVSPFIFHCFHFSLTGEQRGEKLLKRYLWIICLIKTHSRVSAAKKAMWRTSVLFTESTNSPFSTSCISIITRPISIKFTYFMPSYMHSYTPNLKEIGRVVWEICVPENCTIFFTFFFFFCAPLYKSNFEPPFSWIDLFQI